VLERHVIHQRSQGHRFEQLLFRQALPFARAAERVLDDALQLGAWQAAGDALEADAICDVLHAQHTLAQRGFEHERHAPHERSRASGSALSLFQNSISVRNDQSCAAIEVAQPIVGGINARTLLASVSLLERDGQILCGRSGRLARRQPLVTLRGGREHPHAQLLVGRQAVHQAGAAEMPQEIARAAPSVAKA
jgi:hypothetical protein